MAAALSIDSWRYGHVPGGVGALPCFEFKYPFLWLHSRFRWSVAVQQETRSALAMARSPNDVSLLLPGVDGLVYHLHQVAGVEYYEAAVVEAELKPAAEAYFLTLLEPHTARMLQALARGWLVRVRARRCS
jgi:hypothetical protein